MALFYQSEQVPLPLVALNLALSKTSLFKVRNLFYKSVLNECSQSFHSNISPLPNHLEPRGWQSQEVSMQILHPRTLVPGCPEGRGSSRWEQHLAQPAKTPARFPSCGIRVRNSSQDLSCFCSIKRGQNQIYIQKSSSGSENLSEFNNLVKKLPLISLLHLQKRN